MRRALSSPRLMAALESIRAEVATLAAHWQAAGPKALYSIPTAAKKLGVGKTKLRQLIRDEVVLTVPLGAAKMVPASEITRLSTPRSRPRTGLHTVELHPSARLQPRKQTQDPDALDEALRRRAKRAKAR